MRLFFQKKDTLEMIKEATLDLLVYNGYDTISMRQIAKEANVALGQVTYYYHTKEKLIVSVVTEALEFFYNEFKEVIENSKSKINAMTNHFQNLLVNDDRRVRLLANLIAQSVWNKKTNKFISNYFNKIVEYIKSIYLDEIDELDEESAQIRTKLLVGTILENAMSNILELNISNKNSNLITYEFLSKTKDDNKDEKRK